MKLVGQPIMWWGLETPGSERMKTNQVGLVIAFPLGSVSLQEAWWRRTNNEATEATTNRVRFVSFFVFSTLFLCLSSLVLLLLLLFSQQLARAGLGIAKKRVDFGHVG